MKIIHYYHILCNPNTNITHLLVLQHMNAICNYGLVSVLDEIRIGLVGLPEQRKIVKEMLQQSMVKDKIKIVIERQRADEHITLQHMHNASQEEECYYIYGHTKGAYHTHFSNLVWVRSMIFYNIVGWGKMLEKLENTKIDCAGCFWLTKEEYPEILKFDPDGTPFFGGNFYWAKSSYVKTLPIVPKQDRYKAERWIGLNDPKIYCIQGGHPEHLQNHIITF